jgi:hypothetical protein
MNKFQKLVGQNGNDVLERRAEALATHAEIAQSAIVNKLKQEKTRLELEIINLTDLSPETTDSLRPGNKDWDATNWAKKLQTAKQDLYNVKIQLQLAEETYKEYFSELEPTEGNTRIDE